MVRTSRDPKSPKPYPPDQILRLLDVAELIVEDYHSLLKIRSHITPHSELGTALKDAGVYWLPEPDDPLSKSTLKDAERLDPRIQSWVRSLLGSLTTACGLLRERKRTVLAEEIESRRLELQSAFDAAGFAS